ncbi:MAG: hypothetical protein JWP87_4570, partial [Labilithrix sp.]|nr:hypothetical protein [Labilithrix sp.]
MGVAGVAKRGAVFGGEYGLAYGAEYGIVGAPTRGAGAAYGLEGTTIGGCGVAMRGAYGVAGEVARGTPTRGAAPTRGPEAVPPGN